MYGVVLLAENLVLVQLHKNLKLMYNILYPCLCRVIEEFALYRVETLTPLPLV